MRLEHVSPTEPSSVCVSLCPLPVQGWCRCFFCGHESAIPLPLSADQPNWIECEWCELDNEIPAGACVDPVVCGRVPTRIF